MKVFSVWWKYKHLSNISMNHLETLRSPSRFPFYELRHLLRKISPKYLHMDSQNIYNNLFLFLLFSFFSGRPNNTYKSREKAHFVRGKCGTNIRLSIWNTYFIFYFKIFGSSYNFMFNLGTIEEKRCARIRNKTPKSTIINANI